MAGAARRDAKVFESGTQLIMQLKRQKDSRTTSCRTRGQQGQEEEDRREPTNQQSRRRERPRPIEKSSEPIMKRARIDKSCLFGHCKS